MTGHLPADILRAVSRIANTVAAKWSVVVALLLFAIQLGAPSTQPGGPLSWFGLPSAMAQQTEVTVGEASKVTRFSWDFSRSSDTDSDGWPDRWRRFLGTGYPEYVSVEIVPHDPQLEARYRTLDSNVLRAWVALRKSYPGLPILPPSAADVMVDRYLRIDLDGGQVRLQSPSVDANRMYKYRFSCRIMTKGLRHDSARVEFVFIGKNGREITSHSTPPISGTTRWKEVTLDLVRPPVGSAKMLVRLHVERSELGLEDIRGTIGFDDIRIEQYPQIQIATDEPLGVYRYGRPVVATAMVMGLPTGASQVKFQLFDHADREIATKLMKVQHQDSQPADSAEAVESIKVDSAVTWKLPRLDPGFYRVSASLVGQSVSTLATETTVGVIDRIIGGPTHGSFGWTLPNGIEGIGPREAAPWLADLGVAWVKYPCWLSPDDAIGAEEVALMLSKMQDSGIQTIGMLDVPPEDQAGLFEVRGRRDMVAAQLFRDVPTWQPLLEPVMSRLSLKVRTWQLGADRDHSFLGHPRLRDSISQIATGLQGFGQPIDVAISWPWLERQLPGAETSWQAVCRSSDPPLGARELDAFLSLHESDTRGDGPRTWLLLDPISKDKYDRQARIRDLVLRMATVRSHRVQAAFVSNPHDPQRGLLRPDGRPDELLLPWRTTSRMIGNLRKIGSLQLRSGAQNMVFAGGDRAVLVVWSAEGAEEMIYVGDNVQEVDVWGKVTNLRSETYGNQVAQRIQIGPVPKFIIGADPTLLAFRMSVDVKPRKLDSFLGQKQKLAVSFTNPTRESLVGQMRVTPPDTWAVDNPIRGWETLAGRSTTNYFDVVLSNTAKIGDYEVPIQFVIESIPPKTITVYRNVSVGPDGLDFNVTTRLLPSGELRVQIEVTNRSPREQSYECMLFPPPGRQYQRRFITVKPGETIRREIYWIDGHELIGKRMLLRADEQDGPRLLNYPIEVTR